LLSRRRQGARRHTLAVIREGAGKSRTTSAPPTAASPAARKLAGELGVDPECGLRPGGAVTSEDVAAAKVTAGARDAIAGAMDARIADPHYVAHTST
jgi:pyruvate/2-oxoglutarate dehydrogenase complex dihydrolipoamide acyltransferase (E2) component